jgi:DNA modification methylase
MEEIKIRSKDISIIPINKLVLNPKNNNKHPKEQIERLAQLIEFQGFRNPVVVSNRTGFVVAGHGRIEAAKKLGIKDVPVMFQDFENEAQEYAYLTSDNAIASWSELDLSAVNTEMLDLGPDFDIDMLGIKDFVIEPIEKFEPQGDEDAVPDVVHPITRKGDIWLLGNHRLMCGDSTMIDDIEKLMNGEKADLCFTSPPYSDQREYNGNKELSPEHLSDFLIAPSKCFAVNLGMKRSNGEIDPYWDTYIDKAKSHGLKLTSWNIWNRQGFGFSIGNATAEFPIEHEFIFVFGKPKTNNKIVENKSSGRSGGKSSIRSKDGSTKQKETPTVSEFRSLGTVLHVCQEQERSINHPAKFPVELPENYILALTFERGLVYEPFTGSGTTIIGAEKTNRKCYGMELDEKYCDVIIKRWEQYTGKKATLELTGQTYEELKVERDG